MDKRSTVTQSEWPIMELLWEQTMTLLEQLAAQSDQLHWSKSTITTMLRRMDDKGLITYDVDGRAKRFRPAVSREDVAARETDSLLRRAYHGSVGMLVNAMARRNDLTKEDIAELYAILQEAEADAK